MRGNEFLVDCASRRDVSKFPIPMRGNEINDTEVAAQYAVEFPIPMRGNERRNWISISGGATSFQSP